MAYTRNTPQGSDQILTTQPLILGNFQFIKDGVEVEHNFNAAGTGTDMYHLKASMPDLALSPALAVGTNGVYFVNSSTPYFYDGTTNSNLACWEDMITGMWTSHASGTTGVFNNIVVLPANKVGIMIFVNTTIPQVQFGHFVTNATNCFAFAEAIALIPGSTNSTSYINFGHNVAGLQLTGCRQTTSAAGATTYSYRIFYRAV